MAAAPSGREEGAISVPWFIRVPLHVLALFFWAGLTLAPDVVCAQTDTGRNAQKQREWEQEMKRIQEIKEEEARSRAFEKYERFDPMNPGAVKSEWEQFEDPRTAKKKKVY